MAQRSGAADDQRRGKDRARRQETAPGHETQQGTEGPGPRRDEGPGADRALHRGPDRPRRPELYVGAPPPRLSLPPPPASQRLASGSWKLVAAGLALAVGLTFLDLGGHREHVRTMVEERAPEAATTTVERAVDLAFWGGLAAWGALVVVALLLSSGLSRPRMLPRLLGLPAAAAVALVVAYTVLPLVPGHGAMGLAGRVALAGSGVLAVVAGLLGVAPTAWRWVRDHRHD